MSFWRSLGGGEVVGTSCDVGALAPSIILPLPSLSLSFSLSLYCICREVSSLVQCTFFVMVFVFHRLIAISENVNHSKTFIGDRVSPRDPGWTLPPFKEAPPYPAKLSF